MSCPGRGGPSGKVSITTISDLGHCHLLLHRHAIAIVSDHHKGSAGNQSAFAGEWGGMAGPLVCVAAKLTCLTGALCTHLQTSKGACQMYLHPSNQHFTFTHLWASNHRYTAPYRAVYSRDRCTSYTSPLQGTCLVLSTTRSLHILAWSLACVSIYFSASEQRLRRRVLESPPYI